MADLDRYHRADHSVVTMMARDPGFGWLIAAAIIILILLLSIGPDDHIDQQVNSDMDREIRKAIEDARVKYKELR